MCVEISWFLAKKHPPRPARQIFSLYQETSVCLACEERFYGNNVKMSCFKFITYFEFDVFTFCSCVACNIHTSIHKKKLGTNSNQCQVNSLRFFFFSHHTWFPFKTVWKAKKIWSNEKRMKLFFSSSSHFFFSTANRRFDFFFLSHETKIKTASKETGLKHECIAKIFYGKIWYSRSLVCMCMCVCERDY